MEQIDVAIIGAGVVGLAVASEVAREEREVYVFEKHDTFGRETSDRNSEVIHAGIYYEKGSLKARLCAEGKELIYQISQDCLFHQKLGKLIVAVDDGEVKTLEAIFKKATDNGVTDLKMLDQKQVRQMEPNVRAIAAIHSLSTGIVNAHQLMKYFISKMKDKSGGVEPVIYGQEVIGIEKLKSGFKLTTRNPSGSEESILAKVLINSAGLQSDKIAEAAGIDADSSGYRLHFCKGEYFKVSARHQGKISRLIYPIPEACLPLASPAGDDRWKGGLGIHATLDSAGEIKLGPNVVFMPENIIDYTVDGSHRQAFYNSAKRFLPFLNCNDLQPGQAGIRPKLSAEGEPERDFIIQEESEKGLPGLINLIGIESPGLTAAPAIGKYISQIVDNLLK